MRIRNIHSTIIEEPKFKVASLIKTLGTEKDAIWPYEHWPAMFFDNDLFIGSKGGHGLIRYTITDHRPGHCIEFTFSKPKGFNGTHRFDFFMVNKSYQIMDITEIKHTIDMKVTLSGYLKWILCIRWLHDALIEDSLYKIESRFSKKTQRRKWCLWVKLWRWVLKRNKSNTYEAETKMGKA